MNTDRNAPCTIGHFEDGLAKLGSDLRSEMAAMKAVLRAEMADTKAELRADVAALEIRLEHRLHERLTRTLFAEMARHSTELMEHMTSLFRGSADHTKALEERLDAHIADDTVHRRPRRARRS